MVFCCPCPFLVPACFCRVALLFVSVCALMGMLLVTHALVTLLFSHQFPGSAKCPLGKYTSVGGFINALPKCESCAPGFFKTTTSTSSTETDSCTAAKEIQCPAGEYVKATGSAQPKCEACAPGFLKMKGSPRTSEPNACTAHRKCPPGSHIKVAGSAKRNPKCESCPIGFFKATTSNRTTETDSCTAAKKVHCPPGKYIKATLTAQPKCESVSTCPKCGTFTNSGQLSCCAIGGSWFSKCGPEADSNFDYTWFEGMHACESEFTID